MSNVHPHQSSNQLALNFHQKPGRPVVHPDRRRKARTPTGSARCRSGWGGFRLRFVPGRRLPLAAALGSAAMARISARLTA